MHFRVHSAASTNGVFRAVLLGAAVICAGRTSVEAATIFVRGSATGAGNGTSWINAFTTMTAATAVATAGDEIWVAAGTYSGLVTLPNAVSILGGFGGSEVLSSQRNPKVYITTLSGGGGTRLVINSDGDSTTRLSGFVVTGGHVSSPEFGGGMELVNSNAVIERCVFSANTAEVIGGAVNIRGGAPSFINCVFTSNNGGWGGGAVSIVDNGAPTFSNCLFHANQAWEGGAVAIQDGAPSFIGSTIANNAATVGEGGGVSDASRRSSFKNCIIWGNTAASTGTRSFYATPGVPGATVASDSVIGGGWLGGNVDQDPRFLNPAAGYFQLKPEGHDGPGSPKSPAIDTGDTTVAIAGQTDLDGNTRVFPTAGRIDMGAYEFTDCNGNGILDLCDTSCNAAAGACNVTGCGQSADCNGNGVPDTCDSCSVVAPPGSEPGAVAKNRYISFAPKNAGQKTALRVTLTTLPAPFQSFNGTKMWVAAPATTCENSGQVGPSCTGATFWAARLSCDPVFLDWSTYGTVHVYDDEIVPNATYDIQAVGCLCDTAVETNYSASLTVTTTVLWGDITGSCSVSPCTPPDGITDIVDVTAVNDKFQNLASGPSKTRTDLDPNVPNRLVDMMDKVRVLDAVSSPTYPFTGPTQCPPPGGGGPPPEGGGEE